MPHVGIIGLGLLGSAIARRLLSDGRTVVGYDVDAARGTLLQRDGGTAAKSAVQVAQQASLLLLSLPDSDVVARVAAEIAPHAAGRLIIDTTTGDPEAAVATAALLNSAGARYVEATVVGSSRMLRDRDVVILLGGTAVDVADAAPLVDQLARNTFHVGAVGSGARAKLVVNLVLGLHRAVLAEGLNLALRCGLDGALMLDVLRSGLAYSRVMDTKGRRMLDGDFAPEARLRQHHKDVRLILELGARSDAPLPLSRLHQQLLETAESLGLGDLDNSAIIRVLQMSR